MKTNLLVGAAASCITMISCTAQPPATAHAAATRPSRRPGSSSPACIRRTSTSRCGRRTTSIVTSTASGSRRRRFRPIAPTTARSRCSRKVPSAICTAILEEAASAGRCARHRIRRRSATSTRASWMRPQSKRTALKPLAARVRAHRRAGLEAGRRALHRSQPAIVVAHPLRLFRRSRPRRIRASTSATCFRPASACRIATTIFPTKRASRACARSIRFT